MKVRPLYDNIIVKRLEAETTTSSGIIIPDNAKEKPSEGHRPGGRERQGERPG